MSPKSRVLSLLGALALVTTVACADSSTAPQPSGKRSLRDTTVLQGDSTLCRSGYSVINGRIVCNPEA
jgi:hypothetical protein